jgi:hypothetical protein
VTVWVVTRQTHDSNEIKGVYATEAHAERECLRMESEDPRGRGGLWGYEDFEVQTETL